MVNPSFIQHLLGSQPTHTKMSHWTYQPRDGIQTVPLKIHCPRSPILGGTFANGNCNDMEVML